MSIAALRDENEQLKALLAQTQAALSEHQGALAASEEARRRLEVILGELRRDKFGAKSEKLRPDQYHLPLEDVEIAQGILDAAQERAEKVIQGRSRNAPWSVWRYRVTFHPGTFTPSHHTRRLRRRP